MVRDIERLAAAGTSGDADPSLTLIGAIDEPGEPANYATDSDAHAAEAMRLRHVTAPSPRCQRAYR